VNTGHAVAGPIGGTGSPEQVRGRTRRKPRLGERFYYFVGARAFVIGDAGAAVEHQECRREWFLLDGQ
jgi:hypothetical protein